MAKLNENRNHWRIMGRDKLGNWVSQYDPLGAVLSHIRAEKTNATTAARRQALADAEMICCDTYNSGLYPYPA